MYSYVRIALIWFAMDNVEGDYNKQGYTVEPHFYVPAIYVFPSF
jgi:hypothetical protein